MRPLLVILALKQWTMCKGDYSIYSSDFQEGFEKKKTYFFTGLSYLSPQLLLFDNRLEQNPNPNRL